MTEKLYTCLRCGVSFLDSMKRRLCHECRKHRERV